MESKQFKGFWEVQTTPLHTYYDDQWFERYADEIRHYLPTKGTIVDAGCGSGEIFARMSRHYDKMIGIDFSESMLAEAKKKQYANSVEFFQGSIVNINSYCSAKVGAIYCNAVVQHLSIQELREFISNSLTILPSGGKLVILQIPNVNCKTLFRLGFYRHEKFVPFISVLKGFFSLFINDLKATLKGKKIDDGIGNWFSILELKELASSLGAKAEIFGSSFVNYSYRFHVVISKS